MTARHRLALGIALVVLLALGLLGSMVRIRFEPAPPGDARIAAAAAPQVVAAPPGVALAVPVQGVARSAIRDSWGEARGDGSRGHQGTDIMAPSGTPVVAAAAGTVEKLFFSKGGGGITLYLRSPDRRWSYYYAHLGGYAPGLREGQQVEAGEVIGYVGDTGNAGAGNHHLHFGVSRMRPDEGWWQGEPVDPYPLLAAGAAGG